MPEKQLAPRQCKTAKCGRNTRHPSKLCAKCRYHAELDKTEIRYEVAVPKGVPHAVESKGPGDGE